MSPLVEARCLEHKDTPWQLGLLRRHGDVYKYFRPDLGIPFRPDVRVSSRMVTAVFREHVNTPW